jgi:hypothetical protein
MSRWLQKHDVPILLLASACLAGVLAAPAQQSSTSSHFGATAPRPAPASSGKMAARPTLSGGNSSWTAGKGSFGYGRQTGSGSTASAANSARGTTPSAPSALDVFPSGNTSSAGAFTPRSTGARGSSLSGGMQFSHSSSGSRVGGGRASFSRSFGVGHGARGGGGRARAATTSGFTSRSPQSRRQAPASSSLPNTVSSGLGSKGLGSLP